MKSIIHIGTDVHKESYTVCCFTIEKGQAEHIMKIPSDVKMLLKYIENMKKHYGKEAEFVVGYEAGPIGYKLYRELTERNVNCVILAPTTLGKTNTNRVKTDKRDASNIAQSLAYNLYSEVYVPTMEDEAVRQYIRMRDAHKEHLKRLKQQILAFVLSQGLKFTGGRSHWTIAHLKWLRSLEIDGLLKEVLSEYLATYDSLVSKLDRLDARIEEISMQEEYVEKVSKLKCLIGVRTYTALSVIVEIGDFHRFEKPSSFASFVGLVPSEDSSGGTRRVGSITKAGNSHVRKMLIEASQSYARGTVGYKSKELTKRQIGNSAEVIAYADRANERLRRKYYHLVLGNGKRANTAKTAVARELACFMWGLLTDNVA